MGCKGLELSEEMKAVAAILCFATVGVLVKLVDNAVSPITLTFYRMFIGLLLLVFIVPFLDRNAFRLTKRDVKDYFVVGVLMVLNSTTYTAAHFFAPVANVVLIKSSYPFFVMVFAYFILREKITKTKIITLLIALIGLAFIDPFDFSGDNFGNFLALVSAVFGGIMFVEMRKESRTHSIGDVLWFMFFATLILLPFAAIEGFGDLSAVWPYVLLLGVVSTGLAYMLYNLALQKMEAQTSSLLSLTIKPIAAIGLAVLIVGEELALHTIIGGIILIFAGVYLETHIRKIKQPQTHEYYH